MNEVTAYVTEVLSEPYFVDKYNWWAVDVIFSDMGGSREKTLTFANEEKAKEVEKGYKFSH